MKAYGRWNVTLPGEAYVWEPDEITLGECLTIEGEADQTYTQWIRAVGDERAEACQILVWFLRRKAGRQEDRIAVDFPIRKLTITEIVEAVEDDPEASAGSAPATEPTSPSATESDPGNGTS